MTSITDKNGETVAYLFQNIIIDLNQQQVLGLILGNCVFGKEDAPIGKFFNDTFRKKNGMKIARLGKKMSSVKPINEARLLQDAWQLLTKVKEHICMWIDEKDTWTTQDFIAYLSAEREKEIAASY
ncbi:MAG: hypothetical protein NVSMB63_02120 [Sediminibacterium sp.]